jgi:hypothetical protein
MAMTLFSGLDQAAKSLIRFGELWSEDRGSIVTLQASDC